MTNDELRTELQDVKNKLDEIMQMIRAVHPWMWPLDRPMSDGVKLEISEEMDDVPGRNLRWFEVFSEQPGHFKTVASNVKIGV